MNLEDELRNALRRIDPPPGFADRVLARTRTPRRTPYRFAAWAAAAALVVTVGVAEYSRRQAAGELARERTLLALDIAASKLHEVQLKIQKEK